MATCNRCGDQIEFRYVDGRPTPIHLSGGWCSGWEAPRPPRPSKLFGTAESYTVPNAICPVCGAIVFYYQNSSGSRVFFDDLGWPWPKHPCTDNPASQQGSVRKTGRAKSSNRPTRALLIYELAEIDEDELRLHLKFRVIQSPLNTRNLHIDVVDLHAQGLQVRDLRDAPSFIFKRQPDNSTVIEFISVRLGMIARLAIAKNPA